jgi:hypothetical protein
MKKGKLYFSTNDFLEDNKNNIKKIFILVAEYTNFNLEDFKNYNGEIFGGIVPFVVYNNTYYNKGIIACSLDDNSDFLLVENLNHLNDNSTFFKNRKSFLVLLDGLSPNITNFLENLFEVVCDNAQIIGAGAGKMTFENDPVIFTKDKIYKNAAIVIATQMKLHTKIGSGWEYLEGPFLATNSEKNILKTLNFKNAFDVYKSVVEKNCGMIFTDDNFFDVAKSYPFGIVKFNNQTIVRDPIYIDKNNNIVLVGDIFQNSTVNILKGEPNTLIKSSGLAVKELLEVPDSCTNQDVILFDCISRSIFLGDIYPSELEEMRRHMKEDSTLFGALTLGEICSDTDKYISFYNKSCIVGVLC